MRDYALQQPNVVAQLLGYGATRQIEHFVRRRWFCPGPAAEVARELLRTVAVRLHDPPPLAFAFEGERLWHLEYLQSIYNETPPRESWMTDKPAWMIRGICPHDDAVKRLNVYFAALTTWSEAAEGSAEDQARRDVSGAQDDLPVMLPLKRMWMPIQNAARNRHELIADLVTLRELIAGENPESRN